MRFYGSARKEKSEPEVAPRPLRDIFGEIIKKAFDSGISEAWSFWNMTPAEIEGRLKANRRKRSQFMKDQDSLAWMIGLYVGKSYHQPKKYPDRPEFYREPDELPDDDEDEMQEDAMKSAIIGFAEIHNVIEEARK